MMSREGTWEGKAHTRKGNGRKIRKFEVAEDAER